MDDVQCIGTETKLRDCEHDSLTDDCGHNEDAGVACYNQSMLYSHHYVCTCTCTCM